MKNHFRNNLNDEFKDMISKKKKKNEEISFSFSKKVNTKKKQKNM